VIAAIETRAPSASSRARLVLASRLTYGLSVAAMGAMVLSAGSLSALFQPVPAWIPAHFALAIASGAVLVAGGLALLFRKAMAPAALALTINFFFLWFLLLNLPTTVTHPTIVGAWEGCGLNLTVVAGGWSLLAFSRPAPAARVARLFGESGMRLAQRIFAIGVPLVGVAHFLTEDAVEFVPTWLPLRIDWVYLTGAGHIAAGLAILFGVVPRLAAVLEAAQITAFVVLEHIPNVCIVPRDRVQWAMLLYAVAIAASGWLVVATLGKEPPRSADARRVAPTTPRAG
jgi:uncharacterized membrane protein